MFSDLGKGIFDALNGYYARRILAGDRPDYKLPNTGLPVPAVNEMEIKTGYIEALKKNKVA